MGKQTLPKDSGVKKYLDENPCVKEHRASISCLNKTGEKKKCEMYFEAYRDCMSNWQAEKRAERLRSQS